MAITILKWLVWTAAMVMVALAIVYGFYLILIFMLFNSSLVWLAAAGEVVMFGIYFWLCGVADAL